MRSITRRCVAVGVGLSLAAPLLAPAPGGALSFADPVGSAVDWLETQQQDDGSFEVAQFPGFETSDAIAAIAAASQTGPRWDDAQALAAVEALVSTQTRTPLDEIDRLVDADGAADPSTDAAGARAAKVIVLVAGPLGLDPTDVDPADDSPAAVDLGARMDLHRQGDGSYDFGAQFNGTLYSALALQIRGEVVPQGLIDQIVAAQRADGSWDYTGTPAGGPGEDVDTTALALLALSAGLAPTPALSPDAPAGPKASVQAGVNFLASRQQASGAWQAFGADDPNSTALATIALSDLRIDVTSRTWRDATGSPAPGAYLSPQSWLTAQQGIDGHIASPNDSFGVNTLATSQSVQALARQVFLDAERGFLLERWSEDLASPTGSPTIGLAEDLASPALGANPSIKAARTAAANAVIYGPDARAAAASDLFVQALGRTIDPSGRAYWSTKLSTISRTEMLARLTG
ncbi:MAG: hypothetical protein KDA97_00565, partial [Acidimicrobiales bacterium]|nr:hypothetical protein [Acidimicrobiales bacterium]